MRLNILSLNEGSPNFTTQLTHRLLLKRNTDGEMSRAFGPGCNLLRFTGLRVQRRSSRHGGYSTGCLSLFAQCPCALRRTQLGLSASDFKVVMALARNASRHKTYVLYSYLHKHFWRSRHRFLHVQRVGRCANLCFCIASKTPRSHNCRYCIMDIRCQLPG